MRKQHSTVTFGHDLPLGFLLHCGRSIQGSLQTDHSIEATDFVSLNFCNAARTQTVTIPPKPNRLLFDPHERLKDLKKKISSSRTHSR